MGEGGEGSESAELFDTASVTDDSVGVEGGGSWGQARSVSNGTSNGVPNGTLGAWKTSTDISGGIGGGTLGCNYQVNKWVFGIEGDYSWSGERGSSNLVPPFNTNFREEVSDNKSAALRRKPKSDKHLPCF